MKDPEARKADSMTILRRRRISVMPELPVIESAEETVLRTPSEVLQRIICITFAADFAWGYADENYFASIEKHQMRPWFTEKEWTFINNPGNDESYKAPFSWRIEGAIVLAWALRKVPELSWPNTFGSASEVYPCIFEFEKDPEGFSSGLSLIDKEIILDQSDLIYRLHWAVRDATLAGRPPPAKLQAGVVQERHHAINWLTCYGESAEWEDVSTDT
jgi:Domain of unknown function (DUF4272)